MPTALCICLRCVCPLWFFSSVLWVWSVLGVSVLCRFCVCFVGLSLSLVCVFVCHIWVWVSVCLSYMGVGECVFVSLFHNVHNASSHSVHRSNFFFQVALPAAFGAL